MTAPPEAEIEQLVRESGLLAAGRPVVVLLSGGRDSTCLIDLAVAIAGRESVIALHLNYGLRDGADADERHCAELCSRLGVALEVRRPSRPERGNLQAWARDERYGTAAQIALARGGRRRSRAHRDRPGGDDPLPACVVSQPQGSARHAPARRAARAAAARVHARADGRVLHGARAGLARGREQRLRRLCPQPDPGPAHAGAGGGASGRCGQRDRGGRDPARGGGRARRTGRRGAGATRPRATGPVA